MMNALANGRYTTNQLKNKQGPLHTISVWTFVINMHIVSETCDQKMQAYAKANVNRMSRGTLISIAKSNQ